ncbi:hypothetical protein [Streptomyces cavernae]|uniref:hypothetical protein n=1 Tax=Streptomyces cavernae TaxID=2259034 RepID=UPI0012D8F6CB|nr:hypothetical protein [Streptomyces cavernae]
MVQELSGAANGLHGVHFPVPTVDGSVAYFGTGHSPTGPADSDPAQSSSPADASTSEQ